MKLPGCLPPLGMLLAFVTLIAVATIVRVQGHQIFSPGPLSVANDTGSRVGGVTSHAALEADCAACHTPPWSDQRMADRCVACHTEVQTQLLAPMTLHGALDARDCRDCHTEHRGEQASLTQVESLVVDHDQFRFSLAAHQTTAEQQPFGCADCHTESLNRFDPTACETCHRDYQPDFIALHVIAFGNNCQACHDGKDRFSKEQFDHNAQSFPLLGKHATVACTDCHLAVAELADFTETSDACEDCHLKDFTHPASFGTDCAQCHNSEGWETEIFDHDLVAFKLTGKHADVPCADCHLNDVFKGTPQTCVGCHAKDDIHLGQFGTDCEACHTTETWQRGPFEHTFPLDHGGGGIIPCATCHTEPGNYTVYTCDNCHKPADMARVHSFARFMGTDITDCVRCHPTGQRTMMMH